MRNNADYFFTENLSANVRINEHNCTEINELCSKEIVLQAAYLCRPNMKNYTSC